MQACNMNMFVYSHYIIHVYNENKQAYSYCNMWVNATYTVKIMLLELSRHMLQLELQTSATSG